MNRPGLSFRPRACQRCGGDAYFERGYDPEWRCLQCGRTVSDQQQAQPAPQARLVPQPLPVRAA